MISRTEGSSFSAAPWLGTGVAQKEQSALKSTALTQSSCNKRCDVTRATQLPVSEVSEIQHRRRATVQPTLLLPASGVAHSLLGERMSHPGNGGACKHVEQSGGGRGEEKTKAQKPCEALLGTSWKKGSHSIPGLSGSSLPCCPLESMRTRLWRGESVTATVCA